MIICFLDVDGTLNNLSYFETPKNNIYKDDYTTEEVCKTQICPDNVNSLNKLLAVIPDLNIVVSSSWRRFVSLKELTDGLIHQGLKKEYAKRFISKTAITGQKYKEINWWIDKYKKDIDNYIVVDDSSNDYDNLKSFGKHFFQLNPWKGLTDKKVNKIINFLSK